jgi:hypothetical protein
MDSTEVLRIFSDFVYLICVTDIYTDCQEADAVKQVVGLIKYVLRNPYEELPANGQIWVVGQMTKE